jgi:hypothetical protein
MTYNDVLHHVDKDPIPAYMAGNVPFNERIQLLWDKLSNVGEIKEFFTGSIGSTLDPMLRYKRDPFFLQNMQLMAQASPNTLIAYFAPRPVELTMQLIDMEIDDMLEEDGE